METATLGVIFQVIQENKILNMKSICVFFILFLGCSCNNKHDYAYVRSHLWNYDTGFRVGEGDFVEFQNDSKLFELKEDTIFYKGMPREIIKSVDKKLFN